MKQHRPALALLAALIAVSCSKNTSNPVTPPSGPDSYMPAHAGNWWRYASWTLDSLNAKVPGSDAVLFDSVAQTFTFQNRPAFRMLHFSNDTLIGTDTESVTSDGEYAVWGQTDTAGTRGWMSMASLGNDVLDSTLVSVYPLQIELPLPSGTKIPINTTATRRESFGGEGAVRVPKGTFTARQYRDSITAQQNYQVLLGQAVVTDEGAFAQGVGLIRMRNYWTLSVWSFGIPLFTDRWGTYRELTDFHAN